MPSNRFVHPSRTTGNCYTSMFGASRCVRRRPSTVLKEVPIPAKPNDKVDKEPVKELVKLASSKPQLEKISASLGSVKLRSTTNKNRRVNFNPYKKDEMEEIFKD